MELNTLQDKNGKVYTKFNANKNINVPT